MDIADFKKLAPHFKNAEAIVLEGWGEPLIYPELIYAVQLVKEYGSRAGFVTSGWGLDRGYIRHLIRAGVDFIGFSLAGATHETHNRIRINSDLHTVLSTLQDFHRIKIEEGIGRPRLHIVFLMLRDNFVEVPLLPDMAHDLGIEEVVLINLIHVTNEWQENQRVFTCGDDEREKTILEDVETRARALNVKLRISHLSPGTVAVCEEDPLRNLYISVDGEVAPCVFLYPPVSSPMKRIFCGKECSVEKVTFGNIFKESFEAIWNNPLYVAFRNAFSARNKRFGELHSSLLWGVEDIRRFEENPLPEPPEPCKTCHKILGL